MIQNEDFILFDSRFCCQLMDISYKYLSRFELYLNQQIMKYQYLSSLYKFIGNNQSLWYVPQCVVISIQKYDQQRDFKLAESLSKI